MKHWGNYLPDPKEEIIRDGTFNDFCTRAIEVLGINADRKGPLQFLFMKSDENGRGIPGSGHRTNRELLEEMRDRKGTDISMPLYQLTLEDYAVGDETARSSVGQ